MTHASIQSNAPALFRLPDVLARIKVSKATIYRWSRSGDFPRQRPLTPSGSTVAWSAAEVEAWITAKLASNDGTFVGTSADDVSKVA